MCVGQCACGCEGVMGCVCGGVCVEMCGRMWGCVVDLRLITIRVITYKLYYN